MKKRISSFVFVVTMLLSIITITSFAAITPGKPTYGKAAGYGTKFTLTGNQAKDVIAVAEAQVYKKGSELGYSSAWCDAFVIDCARIANVPTSVIPNTRGCKALYDAIINKGGVKVTTPQAGDVVLYYCKTCKNYPHIGYYAGSGYTCEGNVGGSVSNSNRKSVYYCDGSGHTSKSTIQSLYVRPKYPSTVVHTVNFNANGGSGSMASDRMVNGSTLTLPKNTFKYTGYDFTGWNVKRSDGKWYCTGVGWKTENEIAANGYTKSLYSDAWSGVFNTSWTNGTTGAISVTFYAQWKRATYMVNLWSNYSGKNYICNSDFKVLDTTLFQSRNSSVYTLSVDKGRTSEYGALKIVGATAGAAGKDLLWRSSAMGNVANDGYVGDNKTMTLSFWAKSSIAGAKLYTRFGYQSANSCKSVALTTDWRYYSITFVKDGVCGTDLHPYFDKAGTFYISELQLEDGNVASTFVPEVKEFTKINATAGQKYSNLPSVKRNGYNFEGWYTAANGGTKINTYTDVMYGDLCLYAHWSPVTHKHEYTNSCDVSCDTCGEIRSITHKYQSVMTKVPTCATTGIVTYTCSCGDSYSESVRATGNHTGGTATCKVKAKCTVCNQYYGSLKSHTYKNATTKATLSKNGKIENKCISCGKISKTTTVYYPKTIKLSAITYTYNGKAKSPSVTVKDSKGNTLKKDTDYTVKYSSGRKIVGTYNVTVTFKGKYSGTKKLTFKIVPAKATLSKLTAGSKQFTATWKTLSGITGYEIEYSTSSKFTSKTTKKVKVKSSKTNKTTVKKLTKGKKYYVRIRAYKTVNGKPVYGAWSAVKNIKAK